MNSAHMSRSMIAYNKICMKNNTFTKNLKIRWFEYKNITNRICSENFQKLTWWEDENDKTLQNIKMNIDHVIEDYQKENSTIDKYLRVVPFAQLVDAYIKSDTKKYEPGELKDSGTFISDELRKQIKNKKFEDEADSLAFYIIKKLGKGSFGTVKQIKTNPTIIGTEVMIALKTIFNKKNRMINKHCLQIHKFQISSFV